MRRTPATGEVHASGNIVSHYVVLPCNMESFNMEVIYSRESKQPPQEVHHFVAFLCPFTQYGNSNCVITIYKNSFIVSSVTPSGI